MECDAIQMKYEMTEVISSFGRPMNLLTADVR